MSFKKLTISYDDFHDEENGLVPYLASAIMMLIRKGDMKSLQQLMDNIAKVADQLFDLNDEAVEKKKDYDKLQNRLEAIQADLMKKEEAQAAIREQMIELIGNDEEEEEEEEKEEKKEEEEKESSDTLQPAIARDISEIVADAAIEYDPLSELDLALGSLDSDDLSDLSELTVEKVMTNQNVPEALRKAGIVFGDEIDKLASRHEEEMEELEEDVYADFDLQIEDVDQGYVPVPDEPKAHNDPEQLFAEDPADYAYEEDDYSEYDDTYDDIDIFEEQSSSSEDSSNSDDTDEYDEIDFDDDFIDDGKSIGSVDDIFSPSSSANSADTADDDDDDMTSGIVDLDLFN